jgi:hypothetical protein
MWVFDFGQPRDRGADPYPYPWEAPYSIEWLLFLIALAISATEYVVGVFGRATGWDGAAPRHSGGLGAWHTSGVSV